MSRLTNGTILGAGGWGRDFDSTTETESKRRGKAGCRIPLIKQGTGTGVTVRYDRENPDVSILEDGAILGRRVTQNLHWVA
jgi:hypothetical protein